jgi:septal ring factor EnvC (AmiA/AmiB activator)
VTAGLIRRGARGSEITEKESLRGLQYIPVKRGCAFIVGWLLFGGSAGIAAIAPDDSQLEQVRNRIAQLEERLVELARETADTAAESERLNAELELAQARVRENELTLDQSDVEIGQIRNEVAQLADELVVRRQVLKHHLEMVTLLGRPGPLQLMFDVARHGDLETAIGTVATLTAGQVRLVEEYDRVRAAHAARLAALSQIMEQAQREADQLVDRRNELARTRERVTAHLEQLQRSQAVTGDRLADLREREQALQRLMGVLASRDRITGREDVRRYRGALPWPVRGAITTGFGRHYNARYATYTVCNGLRFAAESGAPVTAIFPGVVAFARYFKGYGNMVVIDHGHDVYSLVAGLATIHVQLNQLVTMGLQLGLAAPPKEEGNLYFEIREGEKPRDPRRWLQLEEGR